MRSLQLWGAIFRTTMKPECAQRWVTEEGWGGQWVELSPPLWEKRRGTFTADLTVSQPDQEKRVDPNLFL